MRVIQADGLFGAVGIPQYEVLEGEYQRLRIGSRLPRRPHAISIVPGR